MHEAKRALRRRIRSARRSVPEPDRSAQTEAALERLAGLPELRSARVVLAYVALPEELDPTPLLRRWLDEGRVIAVPVVVDGLLEPRRLRAWEDLVPGPWGIPVSEGPRVDVDAVVVPGVAFDVGGGRLGMGAGYYDRFLAGRAELFTASVAFRCQLVDAVPREAHDVAVRCVVTADAVYR